MKNRYVLNKKKKIPMFEKQMVQMLNSFIIFKLINIIIKINRTEGKKQKQLNIKIGMI
jgi:dipeptide/tripeptide permease